MHTSVQRLCHQLPCSPCSPLHWLPGRDCSGSCSGHLDHLWLGIAASQGRRGCQPPQGSPPGRVDGSTLVAYLVKATPQVLAGKSEGVLKVPSVLGRVSGMVCCAEHLLKILSCPQAPQAHRTAP